MVINMAEARLHNHRHRIMTMTPANHITLGKLMGLLIYKTAMSRRAVMSRKRIMSRRTVAGLRIILTHHMMQSINIEARASIRHRK